MLEVPDRFDNGGEYMRVRNPLRTLARVVCLRAPIEAQLIVTRRCNLSCGYCSEYDNFSTPIPLHALKHRINALHRLRVVNIALLGGEPLLHPEIDEVIAHANRHAQVSLTTNGFLLSDEIIERLNRAGLSNLQVSIDTLGPDPTRYIQKSLKSVAPKLKRIQRLGQFDCHVTLVLCEKSKDEFKATLRELESLGIAVSVNLVHDETGRVEVGGPDYQELWEHHYRNGRPFSSIEYEYGKQLLEGKRPSWQCRAGARFLYVDEFGNVQFCSAQRGRLNKAVTEYTSKDIRAHARTTKGCEAGCSLFCVYRDCQVDNAPMSLIRAACQTFLRNGGAHSRGNILPIPGRNPS
jgi:MoaA/NifB/PqqE/SkfB family radical SAM enzyme